MFRILTILVVIILFHGELFPKNPIITNIYTADPSAKVFNDTLWVYPCHDRDSAKWWDMVDWHVFSTTYMVNYTDHGKAFNLDNIKWAEKFAWAPDCIQRNGKYYFYYPTDAKYIGVAVSNKPQGTFHDPLDKPLLSINTKGVVCNRDFIDPAIFQDDDGSVYMFVTKHLKNKFIVVT